MSTPRLDLVKAHAFGNDFLLVRAGAIDPGVDRAALARATCERHRGIGADGLIAYEETASGASMQLLNADGSHSEVSGNGVRCLGAWIASRRGATSTRKDPIDIATEAGTKRLELLDVARGRYTFRAAMGAPEHVTRTLIDVSGQPVDAVTLRVGNPQCVVLGEVTEERLHTLASALSVHPHFPQGTNVELATVEAPGRVRILIWERGVGPTEASGTGACAAAVAAIQYSGAARDVQVVSPGGSQRVEWTNDGLFLTGWAELIAEVVWCGVP
jgi:diaminopimelate epimerase